MSQHSRRSPGNDTLASVPQDKTTIDFSSTPSLHLDHRVTDVVDYLQHGFPAYPFNRKLDTAFILELAADFERVDLLEQTKTFRWYYDDDLSRVGNPRAALRRWMARAHERAF